MTPLDHLGCQRYTSQFTSDVHSYGLDKAALGPFDVRQEDRTEDDGVLVAQLGERFLGRAFATHIKTCRLGIGPDHLVLMAIGAQSEH